MDGSSSLVPSQRRSPRRAALLWGIALTVLCLGIGCGEYCLFCDDEQDPCDPDPCANKENATAGTCTAVGESDYTCDCSTGYFWKDTGNTCEDPCATDPCDSIANAVAASCEGVNADEFTCDCESGFVWDENSGTCVDDPCDPDPCQGITNAEAGSCEAQGEGEFTCYCLSGYTWDSGTHTCAEGVVGTCADLKACLLTCNGISDTGCVTACYLTWTGCDCELDWNALIVACAFPCLSQCSNPTSKACWDCALNCGFDTQCQ